MVGRADDAPFGPGRDSGPLVGGVPKGTSVHETVRIILDRGGCPRGVQERADGTKRGVASQAL